MVGLLSERVKLLLAQKHMSQRALAECMGLDYSILWRRLKGERKSDVEFVQRIAQELHTTIAYLSGETDNPAPLTHEKIFQEIQNVQKDGLNSHEVQSFIFERPDKNGHLRKAIVPVNTPEDVLRAIIREFFGSSYTEEASQPSPKPADDSDDSESDEAGNG
jgi:transcriptional regulator with XRE-family HTH domain